MPTIGTCSGFAYEGASNTPSYSASIDAGAVATLVFISSSDFGAGVPTFSNVTVGGQTATLVPGGTVVRSTFQRISVYYLFSPPTGSQTVAATLSSQARAYLTTVSITDLETSSEGAAFGTVATNTGAAGTSPTVTVTSASGQLVIDGFTHSWPGTDTDTVDASQVQLWNAGTAGGTTSGVRQGGSREAGAASVVMSWTKSGGNSGWAQLGFGLKPSSGGPQTVDATAAALTLTVPNATITAGAITVTATAVALALTIPDPVVSGLGGGSGEVLAGRTVTWTSSDIAVVATPPDGVTDANGAVAPVITLLAAGSTNLQATCEGVASNVVPIGVTAPVVVASVDIAPTGLAGTVGGYGVLTATPKDGSGNPLTGRAVGWSFSNAAVASVDIGHGNDNPATIRYRLDGTCDIRAWCEGIGSSVVTATVSAPSVPVATVTIAPSTLSGTVGGSGRLDATVKDAGGNPLTGRQVDWRASNPTSLGVTTPGAFTTVSYRATPGGTVTANCEGIDSNSVPVTVSQGTGGVPFFVEDWSSYASFAAWQGSAGAARGWGGLTAGSDWSRFSFDTGNAYPGLGRSLRYDIPGGYDVGSGLWCGQPAQGRVLGLPSNPLEVWLDIQIKWSSNWTTSRGSTPWGPGGAGGCTQYADDHKLLRAHLSTGGNDYLGLKDGHYGNWDCTYPSSVGGYWDVTTTESSGPYWNGQWHRIRLHWKIAAGTAGVYWFEIDGKTIVNWRNIPRTSAPGIVDINWGANLNGYPPAAQSFWLGKFSLYNTDPGWGY